jgi:hypothetical protein
MTCTKEHEMIELEIETYKQNIRFYEIQINNMEAKINDLKKLKEDYNNY